MTNKLRDYICSVLFFVFGLVMFLLARNIVPTITAHTIEVGSGYFPRFIAVAIMVIAVVMAVVTTVMKEKKSDLDEKKEEPKKDLKGGFLTMGLLIIYAFLLAPLGFLLSTAIYLFLQMLVFSNKKNRNILLFLGISIVTPVLLYSLFLYGFSLPLPYGILFF